LCLAVKPDDVLMNNAVALLVMLQLAASAAIWVAVVIYSLTPGSTTDDIRRAALVGVGMHVLVRHLLPRRPIRVQTRRVAIVV
jgi:phosphate/sulfate permease